MATIRKKFGTAEEIQAELARRIEAHRTCSGCKAPLPKPADRAYHFANWTVTREPTVPGCGEALETIIHAVMLEWDLAAPATGQATSSSRSI